ncbi:uncharacterized protein YqeY [Marmoricola sp. OAE513]|uniref:GatB/YqeY domain-containing protein n=1 Tax=Marmoricola sp. OAE513 TaxID=2817894 RepID=UPI001AE48465
MLALDVEITTLNAMETSLVERLRADLTQAMRDRDRDVAQVLRTVLSAIANDEAQPVGDAELPLVEGPIAGAVHGLGAAEVARRLLTEEDVRGIVDGERAERLNAAADLDGHGQVHAADALRAAAAVLDRYLA